MEEKVQRGVVRFKSASSIKMILSFVVCSESLRFSFCLINLLLQNVLFLVDFFFFPVVGGELINYSSEMAGLHKTDGDGGGK